MIDRKTTPDRILESARELFNRKGYSSTTLVEIASDAGVAPGNLTYHFPSKSDLALSLEEQAQEVMRRRWERKREGRVADDYIEHLFFAKKLTWDYRFLLRDYPAFSDDPQWLQNNPYMLSDFKELHGLLRRVGEAGLWSRELEVDVDILARSLWINSRYWMDHLRELENRDQLNWTDIERGVDHHLTLLGLFLSPAAREAFAAAKDAAVNEATLNVLDKLDRAMG